MVKVKTFTTPLKILHAAKELEDLDEQVTNFIAQNQVARVISVSDVATTDNTGATIGIIRVLTYETEG
jgi:hypothetical protein